LVFLFPVIHWLNETSLATSIRESNIVFPLIETVHVLAITLLAGTVAAVDLRLLGLTLNDQKVSTVARQVLPLTWAGFVVMFISGAFLFLAEAEKSYGNRAFLVKMLLLVLAGLNPLIFHSTVFRSVTVWDNAPVVPGRARAAAVASLTLWTGIIVAGRAIAYF
jgi:hypothetical protein